MRSIELRTSEIRQYLKIDKQLPTEQIMLKIIHDPPPNEDDCLTFCYPTTGEDKTHKNCLDKQKVKDFLDQKRQWHKGECRRLLDCSVCLFLKEMYEEFNIDQTYGDKDYPTDKEDIKNREKELGLE